MATNAQYYTALRNNLRQYRRWAYQVSDDFGKKVDELISSKARFGDDSTDSLDASYNSLVSGVNQAAADAQLSAQDFYTAENNVQLMARANAQGSILPSYPVPIQSYGQTTVAGATSSILGIPVWVLAVVAGFILLKKHR